jgi:hypothetical protein
MHARAAALALAALALTAAPAHAAVPTGNLLVNAGAEDGGPSSSAPESSTSHGRGTGRVGP